MMKINISLKSGIKSLLGFLKRFHTIIFFLIVSACLFTAIVLLLPITNLSMDESQAPGQTIDSSFDQATINRLRNNTSAGSSNQPGERKSPFSE